MPASMIQCDVCGRLLACEIVWDPASATTTAILKEEHSHPFAPPEPEPEPEPPVD